MKLLSLTVVLGLTFLLLANQSFGIHLDNQPLEEFIYRNVQEACKYLYSQKCMIIFGPDVRSDLIKLTQSFEFSGRFKFEVNTRDERLLFFQDIPMVYIPTISGVHVLPDATGKWTELVQKPEPTAYGKFRRYF